MNSEEMAAIGVPMETSAHLLSSMTHMTVIDKTGLKGRATFI